MTNSMARRKQITRIRGSLNYGSKCLVLLLLLPQKALIRIHLSSTRDPPMFRVNLRQHWLATQLRRPPKSATERPAKKEDFRSVKKVREQSLSYGTVGI